MPQMAPINWMLMFLYFLTTYYTMLNLMYFNFLKNNKNIKLKKKMMNKNFNKLI